MRVAVTVETTCQHLIPSGEGNAEQITTNIDMPEKLEAPITKGDVLGTVTYSYKGIEVGSANLIATNDVERNNILHAFHLVLKVITSPFFFIPAILLILLIMYARYQKKKRERTKTYSAVKEKQTAFIIRK